MFTMEIQENKKSIKKKLCVILLLRHQTSTISGIFSSSLFFFRMTLSISTPPNPYTDLPLPNTDIGRKASSITY